ncbi:GPP34 family phosphoprotein [Actinoplanes sp. NPDC051470]|uniref:GOLPH3/VPS74 family protein n=1 Tax=Actinoplanes sp. NPDC051470 TaxID=3157224 RepID=UPI003430AB7F
MAIPGSLAQRAFLLAYNPDKGRIGWGVHLGAVLRAAALADLYLEGHLTDENGRPAVAAVRRPPHDPVLVALLGEIAGARPRKWQVWVGRRHRHVIAAVRQQLSEGGWVRLEPRRILGLFPTTKVTIRDPRVRRELLRRVGDAMKEPVLRVEPADAALVTLVAEGRLTHVLDRRAKRAGKRRFHDLAELTGPVGPALRKAIQSAEAAQAG